MGDTVCDPLRATVVPLRSALTAFCVDQVRVEVPPAEIEAGLATIPADGDWAWAGTQSAAIPVHRNQHAQSSIRTRSFSRGRRLRCGSVEFNPSVFISSLFMADTLA